MALVMVGMIHPSDLELSYACIVRLEFRSVIHLGERWFHESILYMYMCLCMDHVLPTTKDDVDDPIME